MKSKGIQYVHIYGVDNALIQMADPAFLGFCITKAADCAVKAVEKIDPSEPIGVVGIVDGKFRVNFGSANSYVILISINYMPAGVAFSDVLCNIYLYA